MSYTINKTNGEVLVEVIDGTVDQTATDLTLIGKNSSAYGEFFNENLIKLLENFANDSQPTNPITGQLWFDTNEGRIKVYDGNGFKVSGGTIVTGLIPTLTQGDLWIDSVRKQLYFNDGTETLLAGPIYTEQQGYSGFQVTEIPDSYGINRTVLMLYLGQILLGIFSTQEFSTQGAIAGYGDSGSLIKVGFNTGTFAGFKFDITATKADKLIAADNSLKAAEDFMIVNENASTTGALSIQNSTPLILGENQNLEFNIDTSIVRLNLTQQNQNFEINSYNSNGIASSIFVNAENAFVGVYTDTPTSTLDVNGDTRIRGSLTVDGNMTVINSAVLSVDDKNIELGSVASIVNVTGTLDGASTISTITVESTSGMIPGMTVTRVSGTGNFGTSASILSVDDSITITITALTNNTPGDIIFTTGGPSNDTANNAGIIVKAGLDTDKTLLWNKSFSSWTSSENIDIASGKTYKIDGTPVLTATSLGMNITTAPGLHSIGTLDAFQSAYIAINATGTDYDTISFVKDTVTTGNIVIKPKGTGYVSVSNAIIKNVANPADGTDAVNKTSLENAIKVAPMGFSAVTTGLTVDNIRTAILQKVFPAGEHVDGAICRIYCVDTIDGNRIEVYTVSGGVWQHSTTIY